MEGVAVQKWNVLQNGIQVVGKDIYVRTQLYGKNRNGIILIDKENGEKKVIDFDPTYGTGNSFSCILKNVDYQKYYYVLHEDGCPIMDRHARSLVGHRYFGEEHIAHMDTDQLTACMFINNEFRWKDEQRLHRTYADSIYYGMHVRGFTKDASSKIKEAGTFLGVTKKISYLEKLGVTGVVLQPVYETEESESEKVNYWGYAEGYYYAPKNAYAFTDDAVNEFKNMVLQLHRKGIEVILQFYFPAKYCGTEIRDILSYWSEVYHIDGFHIMGECLPLIELGSAPELSSLKLWAQNFPYDELGLRMHHTNAIQENSERALIKTLATFDREYMYTMRRFLKGDANMISPFIAELVKTDTYHGEIKHLSSYDGFRLWDVFSYNWKHNEDNGENNSDGEVYNCSWNCGAEGTTKKKSILQLRLRQMKNALTILLTSQGTPYLFMGDEYGKSGEGNNNPYCQDNEITWQKWNLKKQEKELLEFTRKLIELRKEYGCLTQNKPFRNTDYLSYGYPDISYHGMEAWKVDSSSESRMVGVLLNENYLKDSKKKDRLVYLVYNMHWESHQVGLPKLCKNHEWKCILETQEQTEPKSHSEVITSIPGRSIQIYVSGND